MPFADRLPAATFALPAPPPRQPAARPRSPWRLLLWLLVACVVAQGLATGARRALGPGHHHRLPVLAAVGTVAGSVAVGAPHRQGDDALPFGGRLRFGAASPPHSDPLHHHGGVEHHVHAANTPGIVSAGTEGGAPLVLARLLILVQQALDLPSVLPPAAVPPAGTAASAWPLVGNTPFDSRSTGPLLRPPQPH